MRPSRQSVTTPGDGCRSGRRRRLLADGGQRRRTFSLQERVALARRIWSVKGYETTARRRDGNTYVLARSDNGTTELVRIAGEQPSSEATLGSIESLRDAYEFDTAYYFDPDRSLQPLDTDVKVLDRKRIARIVSQYDLPETVPEPSSEPEGEAHLGEESSRTTGDSGGAFEAYPPVSSTALYLYVVGGFLGSLAVSALAVGLVFLLIPNTAVVVTGILLATGLSVWVGYRMYRYVQSSQRGNPVLRIDDEGIHFRRSWSRRSIPWGRIVGVYQERQTVRFQAYSREYDWLAIEVTEFEGEKGTSYLHRVLTTINNALMGTSGDHYRIRADQYEADFREIETAVDRYADVPVERRDR